MGYYWKIIQRVFWDFMFKRFFSIQCNAWGLSDVGQSRAHNEDHILLNSENNLFLLADGMGGHQAGEVASKMATTTIERILLHNISDYSGQPTAPSADSIDIPEVDNITEAISHTNALIHTQNQKRGFTDGKGMGTTIAGCWYLAKQKMALIFHVGDSRAYSIYNKEISRITRDHSLLELWEDNKLDGEKPTSNVLTKALGPFKTVTTDISLYPLRKGENILLCSDGLSNMVADKEILSIVIQYKNNLQTIPQHLINQANQAGGKDNISVILINFC